MMRGMVGTAMAHPRRMDRNTKGMTKRKKGSVWNVRRVLPKPDVRRAGAGHAVCFTPILAQLRRIAIKIGLFLHAAIHFIPPHPPARPPSVQTEPIYIGLAKSQNGCIHFCKFFFSAAEAARPLERRTARAAARAGSCGCGGRDGRPVLPCGRAPHSARTRHPYYGRGEADMDEMPRSFLRCLARDPEAMKRFAALPEGVKEQQLARARGTRSRAELEALVREL